MEATDSYHPEPSATKKIAVVIPCFRVAAHIQGVLARIGPAVWRIYVVDDKCPQGSGDLVESSTKDPRVVVVRNAENLGVGGAVMAGYEAAMQDGADVMVKIDGDGQMDPSLIARFVNPILEGRADYTKGNRFFDLNSLHGMPALRLIGNAGLSFMAKISTGYWTLFDPTNGYTAIDARVASWLPLSSISKRYFFETDILFRLNTIRAVVADIPMDAVYGDEESSLKISKIAGEFLWRHIKNTAKRIFYNYLLRDMSLASMELALGTLLVMFGSVWGLFHWIDGLRSGLLTPLGTIMVAVLTVLLGSQFLIGFLGHDVASVPAKPCAATLGHRSKKPEHAAMALSGQRPATSRVREQTPAVNSAP